MLFDRNSVKLQYDYCPNIKNIIKKVNVRRVKLAVMVMNYSLAYLIMYDRINYI